jgi:hypothetical protein
VSTAGRAVEKPEQGHNNKQHYRSEEKSDKGTSGNSEMKSSK